MSILSIGTGSHCDNASTAQAHGESTIQRWPGDAVSSITRWLQAILDPNQVVELRALDVERPGLDIPLTMGGYFDFDHLESMAAEAMRFSGHARGVYFTLNPVKPDLLARAYNRTRVLRRGEATTEADVIARRLLLIDLDPTRPTGVSATEAEKQRAYDRAGVVREHLRGRGWPDGIVADSGNGFHLLYRINLETASPLVKSVLDLNQA